MGYHCQNIAGEMTKEKGKLILYYGQYHEKNIMMSVYYTCTCIFYILGIPYYQHHLQIIFKKRNQAYKSKTNQGFLLFSDN